MDATIVFDWLEFAVRWTHVVTAIAWIGSSFYFIALDLGLNRDIPGPADGEEWQVHGGGFYHVQKYLVAPAALPEHLTWFKWESYATWISGVAMLAMVYWLGADLYLVDPAVLEMPVYAAVALSAGSLAVGWVLYDLVCRSRFGDDATRLMLGLYVILVAMSWGYTQVFSGRAALLHLGAFTATIMTANVFFIIIPKQTVVVADLRAGRVPDPRYGKTAKQRSTHNNYLTLPVIFLMLSNHYPLAFASRYNWLIAALVFLMGVAIRHFFNTRHARRGEPWWTWAAAAALFALIVWLSAAGQDGAQQDAAADRMTPETRRFADAGHFAEAYGVVVGRCSMCHAAEPAWEGISRAPRGVRLETEAEVALHARQIYLQAGVTHAMPPANVSFVEPEERALLRAWYREATGRGP